MNATDPLAPSTTETFLSTLNRNSAAMNYTNEQLKQLSDAILAHLDGNPVQAANFHNPNNWETLNMPSFSNFLLWRPKPEPGKRPWSKPEDVPGPVCWIINKNTLATALIVATFSTGFRTVYTDSAWSEMMDFQYSTDRKTWHPCEVTEGEV